MARSIDEIVDRQIRRWSSMAVGLHCEEGDPASGQIPELVRPVLVHPVICISRDLGSGAREVVSVLCERLGYDVFGHAVIDEIARDMHVQRQVIDSMDETSRNELELVIESYLKGREIDSQEYHCSLVRVIKAMALRGGLILLGRGASFILGDQSALNVLITAPEEERIERLMGYLNVDRDTARKQLHESDIAREKFAHKMFGKDIHDIGTYDMLINTSRVSPPMAAQLILKALELRGYDLSVMSLAEIPSHGMEAH